MSQDGQRMHFCRASPWVGYVQELPELVDGGERREPDIMEEVEEIDLADLMSETIGGDPNLRTEL